MVIHTPGRSWRIKLRSESWTKYKASWWPHVQPHHSRRLQNKIECLRCGTKTKSTKTWGLGRIQGPSCSLALQVTMSILDFNIFWKKRIYLHVVNSKNIYFFITEWSKTDKFVCQCSKKPNRFTKSMDLRPWPSQKDLKITQLRDGIEETLAFIFLEVFMELIGKKEWG